MRVAARPVSWCALPAGLPTCVSPFTSNGTLSR